MLKNKITTFFLDIGGVILTNGWDFKSRQLAAGKYHLDPIEMESRHKLTFNTYELGKLTLTEYLDRTVFYEKRKFSKAEFRSFMFAQSKELPGMLKLFTELKKQYHVRIAVVNNEGRELNTYRIRKFKLTTFVDFFVSSCFVHFSKPDIDIFKVALDIAQVDPKEVVYIEDRPMFISIAESLGIKGIPHLDLNTTRATLTNLGFELKY